MKIKRKIIALGGFIAGVINGMLGAGGGMIVVPTLNKSGVETKKSHATSVAIILSISLVSSFFYLKSGTVTISDVSPYILWGVIGSVIGSFLLTKINDIWLHRIFGALMIWAAIRMLIR